VTDDDEIEYAKTIRWLIASVIAMLIAVVFSAIVMSGEG
jgi:hypothetical protein